MKLTKILCSVLLLFLFLGIQPTLAKGIILVNYDLSNNKINLSIKDTVPTNKTDNPVLEFVEVLPSFVGGQQEFYRFIGNNLVYPESAIEAKKEGLVIIKFIVTNTGNIDSIKVLRGFDEACNQAAIDLMKKSPKWSPGMENGRNVSVWFTLPLRFKLPDYLKNNADSSAKAPYFEGGEKELAEFLHKNVIYPKDAKRNGITGEVIVSFIVEENGDISNAEIREPMIIDSCNKEALRVIQMMPKWHPGEKDGKPTRFKVTLSIKFN